MEETISSFLRDNRAEIERMRHYTWDISQRARLVLVLPLLYRTNTGAMWRLSNLPRYGFRNDGLQVFIDDKEATSCSFNCLPLDWERLVEVNNGESLDIDDEFRELFGERLDGGKSAKVYIYTSPMLAVSEFVSSHSSDIRLLDKISYKLLGPIDRDTYELIRKNTSEKLLEIAKGAPYSSMLSFINAWDELRLFDLDYADSVQFEDSCIKTINAALAEVQMAGAFSALLDPSRYPTAN